MNPSEQNKVREASWRRPLTAAEDAELRSGLSKDPDALIDWQLDTRLTQLLGTLPDAPVSSNFTARVLQSVEREGTRQSKADTLLGWLRRGWMPKTAFASVLVCAAMLGYHRQNVSERNLMAKQVAALSAIASETNPENFEDFDAIRLLNKTASADMDLLAVLSE